MKRSLLLLILFTLLIPNMAYGYSYGDPTQEDVAETLKIIVAKVGGKNQDWNAAFEAYKVRRSEISSHFGESVAVTLDVNFADKDSEALIANYKAVLVMNLKRRFDYAEKDINDYSKAKLLLAKAKGTYDVLHPYVEAKKPGEVSKILTAFDKALEALGNPGLFGVGQKEVNVEEYKKQVSYIYKTLKPLFPYKAATKKTEEPKKEQGTQPTTTKPATSNTTTTTQTTKKTDSKVTPTTQGKTTEKKATSQETKTPVVEEKKSEQVVKAEEKKAEEVTPATEETKVEEATAEVSAETPVAEEVKVEEATTEEPVTEELAETADKEIESAVEHAPMDRTDKTNPLVSIVVVLSVLLIGGGTFFFAKKKGFI